MRSHTRAVESLCGIDQGRAWSAGGADRLSVEQETAVHSVHQDHHLGAFDDDTADVLVDISGDSRPTDGDGALAEQGNLSR